MKVAAIGCGHWAKPLCGTFLSYALNSISDPSEDLRKFSEKYNVPHLIIVVLESDCDGVVISAQQGCMLLWPKRRLQQESMFMLKKPWQ